MRKLEMNNKEIREAKDEISALANAEEKGIEKGREEGIELTKKVFKLFQKGKSIIEIAKECGVEEDKVREILE